MRKLANSRWEVMVWEISSRRGREYSGRESERKGEIEASMRDED